MIRLRTSSRGVGSPCGHRGRSSRRGAAGAGMRGTGPGAGVNGRRGEEGLAVLIERSAGLKRDLVDFACSPRLERSLAAAMLEAGLEEGEESCAIGTIDRFALQYRLPDGKTVVDRFVASRPDLDAADREMLLGWRDPVEGIFEIRSKDGDAIILLNLLDDLEYRTYSNMGRAAFRRLPRGGFVHARLVPIRPVPGVWLVSGTMRAYRKSGAAQVAQAAMEAATRRPELVFRNPEKIEQGCRPGPCGRQAVCGRAARLPAVGDHRAAAVAAPGRRLPGHGGRGVPEDPAQAGLHLDRARRGADATPEGLVLPARAPSGRLGDRRPPGGARLRRSSVKARTPTGRSRLAMPARHALGDDRGPGEGHPGRSSPRPVISPVHALPCVAVMPVEQIRRAGPRPRATASVQ